LIGIKVRMAVRRKLAWTVQEDPMTTPVARPRAGKLRRSPVNRQETATRPAVAYYFSKELHMPFEAALEHTTAALARKGFGVLSTIDVSQTMRSKLGVAFRPYKILGACNPHFAYRALRVEDKIGTMLPCNVVVTEKTPGTVEVSAVDPGASVAAISNPELTEVADTVRELLSEVIEGL
jgi:uncharacterized protein (DUF302 family)